jgi:hypothetical protein
LNRSKGPFLRSETAQQYGSAAHFICIMQLSWSHVQGLCLVLIFKVAAIYSFGIWCHLVNEEALEIFRVAAIYMVVWFGISSDVCIHQVTAYFLMLKSTNLLGFL